MRSMISSVRSFGAPVIEPGGNAARTQSIASEPSRRRPRTTVTIWWTVAYGSTTIRLRDLDGAQRGDPAEVVAHEVRDHQVLRPRLLVAAQLRRPAGVLERLRHPRRRPLHRARLDDAVPVHPQEALGRGAQHRLLAEPQQRSEGRRVPRPQRTVGPQRIEASIAAELGGQADLVGLALDDLAPAGGDVGQVRLRGVVELEAQRAGRSRGRRQRRRLARDLAQPLRRSWQARRRPPPRRRRRRVRAGRRGARRGRRRSAGRRA